MRARRWAASRRCWTRSRPSFSLEYGCRRTGRRALVRDVRGAPEPAGGRGRRLAYRHHRAEACRAGRSAEPAGAGALHARLDDGRADRLAGARAEPTADRDPEPMPRPPGGFSSARRPISAEIRNILTDIVDDDKRAGEVIQRLRELLRKGDAELVSLDLNVLIRDVAKLLSSDALIRNVTVTLELDPELPIGDRGPRPAATGRPESPAQCHGGDEPSARGASGRSSSGPSGTDARTVRVSVQDAGPGLRAGSEDAGLRAVLHDEAGRHGHGAGDCPTRSSTPMAASSGPPTTRPGARRSTSPCRSRPWLPRRRAPPASPRDRPPDRRPAVLPRLRPARAIVRLGGVNIGLWSHGGRASHRADIGRTAGGTARVSVEPSNFDT